MSNAPVKLPILRPVAVEPVNAILLTRASRTRASPWSPGPWTIDNIEHASWQACLLRDLSEKQGRQRRLLGRLENDGIAGGQRGSELRRRVGHRIIPWDDGGDYAVRLHDSDVPEARLNPESKRPADGRSRRRKIRRSAPPAPASLEVVSRMGRPASSVSRSASSRRFALIP